MRKKYMIFVLDSLTTKKGIYQPNKNLNGVVSGNCGHGIHFPVQQDKLPRKEKVRRRRAGVFKLPLTQKPNGGHFDPYLVGDIGLCPLLVQQCFTALGVRQNSPILSG